MTTFLTLPASAHTLKSDGTISAVLHLQPDDDPVSGKPTEYILFLSDSTKRFSMADCDCTVTIKENGKILISKPLQLNPQNIIGGTVTFPKTGAYEMVFHGSPVQDGAFQPFTLNYSERVISDPEAVRYPSVFMLSMGAVILSMIIIAFLIKIRYNTLGKP